LTKLPENNRLERIWLLAKTDFKKRYYGSVLGLFWALINPLFRFFIYYFIFTVIFTSRTDNYALFLFLGLIVWMFFQESTKTSISIIRTKRFILENIQINQLDVYYAVLMSTTLGFCFNFSVYFLASLFFDVHISFMVLLLPVLFINLLIFVLGMMILLSVIHIFIRDIMHIWDLLTLMLFWFSGILFVVNQNSGDLKEVALAYLTPITGILINLRAILIYGKGFDIRLFIYDFAYAIIFLAIAYTLLKKYYGLALEKL
jgi:ABC-type polysaccharide/polyol phosphate export permease